MKTLLFTVLSIFTFYSAATAQVTLIHEEDFENPTTQWTTLAACTGFPWYITTSNASSGTKSVVFNSYNAANGCTAKLTSPLLSVVNPGPNDSIYMLWDYYRENVGSTYNDLIELNFLDSAGNELISPSPSVPRYNSGGTGWIRYIFRAKLSLAAGATKTVKFKMLVNGVSANGYDLLVDNFEIYHIRKTPVIELTSPNGAEVHQGGTPFNITWYTPTVNKVNLQYSSNGGSTWSTIATNIDGYLGSYTWNTPTAGTNNAKVRILDASNTSYNDESDAVFTIIPAPTMTLTNPNGGNTLNAGSNYNITWTSANTTDINLEYSTNGGTNWTTIASQLAAGTGSYSWTVPNVSTTTAKVRISDYYNTSFNDVSDANFTITPAASITLTNPNGGNTLSAGNNYNITWSATNVANVNLELSTNGGSSWNSIVTNISATTGSYNWSVPATPTTTARVRVSSATNSAVNDASDANFTIDQSPFVQLLTPNGGNNIGAGSTYYITWTSANVTNVNLELSLNGGTNWTSIVTSLPAGSGVYAWSVPASASTTARVRISSTSNASINDMSDANFTIDQTPFVQLTSPNGGNTIAAGSIFNITWTYGNVSNVNLELSLNGGSSWSSIVSNLPAGSGSYSWTVPASASATAKVRISNSANTSINDISDADFTIEVAPFVQLTNPNGGNTIGGGSSYNITWTSSNVANVNLELSVNGGANWTSIASSLPAATGTYAWTVPSSSTSTAKVRISNSANTAISDMSDANFSIDLSPFVQLSNPNGGNTIAAGSIYNITWTYGNVTNVNLEFSVNGGVNWTGIATGVSASTGTYAWNVPPVATTTAKVRVVNAANTSMSDESDAYFSITLTPVVQLTNPNGGNTLTAGNVSNITWTSSNITNINIEFSVNGGVNWNSIVTNQAAAAGTYAWTVPAAPSATCKVRITDAANTTVSDESDAYFTIQNATGINGQAAGFNLNVYPNPGQGLLNITFDQQENSTLEISISELSGKVIFTKNIVSGNGELSIDLREKGIKDGIYLLELNDGKKISRQKFVVNN
jgi:predicted methyltransferase